MFYKVIEEFSDVITSYSVFKFEKYGSAVSFVAKVEFIDGSILRIKDYLFLAGKRKYSYHWQNVIGNLIIRWDNSPHHKEVSTFPHHKHLPDKIIASKERNIRDVFEIIKSAIKEK